MSKKQKLEVPVEGVSHKAQNFVKGAMGGIPIVGGAAGEVFDMVYKSGYEKRIKVWRELVSERINELAESRDLSTLLEDEEFHSLIAESTLVALKNHQQEKIHAVLNLLYNSTISPVEYDFKKLFLNYIDQFTAYHLRTIGMIAENQEVGLDSNSLKQKILEDIFHGDQQFFGQVQEELENVKGLITYYKKDTKERIKVSFLKLTKLGTKFVELIS